MAERSTAAVGVADTSGENEPLTARPDGADADSATDRPSGAGEPPAGAVRTGSGTDPENPDETAGTTAARPADAADTEAGTDTEAGREAPESADTAETRDADPDPPELHSGHKLARRYRLEECVTRLEGFSSWRAVDEKLRRAVGVHLISARHPRAREVLAAARSAALLADPRFVQVLDAVEEDDLVYVVHEWLPDATSLSDLLPTAPLEAHEAYQLADQLSQALAGAHREGLAHLRLNPATVLRTGSGQFRIRGLAVNAALRGITSDTPQRTDTEAIGAVLYAALTQRWPYEGDAYGLPGVGSLSMGTLAAPDQVRAGVHRGLSALAMRALINDGATASRQEQPCTTPEELARAVAAMPRVRPPEPAYTAPPPYQRAAQRQGAPGAAPAAGAAGAGGYGGTGAEAPAALPGRTGKVLKWAVTALLIAALGLGSWQIADALLKGDSPGGNTEQPAHGGAATPAGDPVEIVGAKDFDPEGSGGTENPEDVPDAYDGKQDTYWLTSKYYGHAEFGNLKSGVGLILDLGRIQQVGQVKADFIGETSADLRVAPRSATGMPTSLDSFEKVASGTSEHLTLKPDEPVKTRYVLLWLTKLPATESGDYRGRVTEIDVTS